MSDNQSKKKVSPIFSYTASLYVGSVSMHYKIKKKFGDSNYRVNFLVSWYRKYFLLK